MPVQQTSPGPTGCDVLAENIDTAVSKMSVASFSYVWYLEYAVE